MTERRQSTYVRDDGSLLEVSQWHEGGTRVSERIDYNVDGTIDRRATLRVDGDHSKELVYRYQPDGSENVSTYVDGQFVRNYFVAGFVSEE